MEREESAVRDQIRRRRATGINELRDAWSGKALRIRTELTRSTRGAVTRILEVADKVVMLERCCDEEDCIEREAHGGEPPASLPCATCHIFGCYASPRTGTTLVGIDPRFRPVRQCLHALARPMARKPSHGS